MSKIKLFFTKKLKNKYRLIIRNDENLKERISFVLTPLNVLLLFSSIIIIILILFSFLIAYTPVGHIIPSRRNYVTPQKVRLLENQLDSLEQILFQREQSDSNLLNILKGLKTSQNQPINKIQPIFSFATHSHQNPELNLKHMVRNKSLFFPPINGFISDTFSVKKNHLALDIVSYRNASVKSTLDGTVILNGWTPDNGHIMLIQHSNNLISVYKHNAVLLKDQGDRVKAGEVIALIGNSGELTSGAHLHFELWLDGRAINPLEYVNL